MANDENLKKGVATQFTTGEEAARAGHKGGVASGIARRKKYASRKFLKEVLAYTTKPKPGVKKTIEDMGGNPDVPLTVEQVMVLAVLRKCMAGDLRAVELVHEYLGEDPRTLLEEKRLKVQKEAVSALKNSDGFMEALTGVTEEVFEDGGDTPDALEDTD